MSWSARATVSTQRVPSMSTRPSRRLAGVNRSPTCERRDVSEVAMLKQYPRWNRSSSRTSASGP